MDHFPVQGITLVSWDFSWFYYTEVCWCVAGVPKQQHAWKQKESLSSTFSLRKFLTLFFYFLEVILSGFAIELSFTSFSITNPYFLILVRGLIFKISFYFECIVNIAYLYFFSWHQIAYWTSQKMKGRVKKPQMIFLTAITIDTETKFNYYVYCDIWCLFQFMESCSSVISRSAVTEPKQWGF